MNYRKLAPLYLPGALVGAIVLVTLAVPILPLQSPVTMDVAHRLAPPSLAHPLGQDEYGRDLLTRILWGARASLAVSISSALIAALAGTVIGLVGGYFRGITELFTVRLTETILCLPPLLLALLVVTLMGPGAGTLIIALSILFTPGYARVVYAETLAVRSLSYVTAQESLGTHPARILVRTIFPNIVPPLLVQISLTMASAMLLESGLSFLGLGVVPPSPSWGLMIRSARATMAQAPFMLLWPCLALTGTIILLNLLCDRLRDVLDPHGAARGASWLRTVVGRVLPGTFDPKPRATLLNVRNLTLELSSNGTTMPLVRDVSLSVAPGETVALVGESGSGKTLTGLAILGLLPPVVRIAEGEVRFTGRDGGVVDLTCLPEPERRRLRGDQISMVFQDASASLNPVHRVGAQVAEAVLCHRDVSPRAARARAVGLLKDVGLPDAAQRAQAFPHELSGGQRQRAMIATAVANGPRLLIADEPTTALDTTIQAQILELLESLKATNSDMGMIFVTHNLAVVAEIADRVCVMYAGEVVEEGPVGEVFQAPRHPYTAALLASVPEGDAQRLAAIPGTVPAPNELPPGCRFAPRCAFASAECEAGPVILEAIDLGRTTRCLKWREVA